jgi:hypothetical protein
MIHPIAAASLLALAACTTTVETAPPGLDQAVVQSAPLERAWLVHDGDGRPAGSLVLYREPSGEQRHLYIVRNVHQQDIGLIDAQGRAYRYRPYAEPDWVATGTVLEGVCRVLGLGDGAELREVSPDELSPPGQAH